MTIEKLFCEKSNIVCNIAENRCNLMLKDIEKLRKVVSSIVNELVIAKHKIIEHAGHKNEYMDFFLEGNKTLSVKSNKGDIKLAKVVPQNIGQITRKKWIEYFNNGIPLTDLEIKQKIYNDPSKYLSIYFKNLFTCDYLAWIYKSENVYTGRLLHKLENPEFNNKLIKFTKTPEEWNESSTVKILNNDIWKTIGEFQFHNNRNNIKFRFNLNNLLDII